MTGLQVAITSGLLLSIGAVLLYFTLAPVRVDLRDAAGRFSPQAPRAREVYRGDLNRYDRAGIWAQRVLPSALWADTSQADLAILAKPLYRHRGEKVVFGLAGLLLPPVASAIQVINGADVQIVPPVIFSLVLGAAGFFLPDISLKSEAKKARTEFRHALVSYVDLVAMQRRAARDIRSAMEYAAQAGDAYPFVRISRALALSNFERTSPWDALERLGDEIGVEELVSLASTMRDAGVEGASSFTALHAQSMQLRDALLTDQRTAARDRSRATTYPVMGIALVFVLGLAFPFVTQLLSVANIK